MKKLFAPLLAFALGASAFAQNGVALPVPPSASDNKAVPVAPVVPASAAEVSAPLVLKDGAIVSGHFKTGQSWSLQNQPP